MRTTLFIFFLLVFPDPDWIGENPLKFAAANLAFLVLGGATRFLLVVTLPCWVATRFLLAVQPVLFPCLTAIRARGLAFGDRIPLTTVSMPLFKARLPAFFSSGTADRNNPFTT